MIRTGTTLILGHDIKGQDKLWYFVRETLLARNRLVFMRRPEWIAGAFTICNWIVRPSFVRLSIRLSVISSRLHINVGWLHSSQI